jgi:hypothetical protein
MICLSCLIRRQGIPSRERHRLDWSPALLSVASLEASLDQHAAKLRFRRDTILFQVRLPPSGIH